MGKNGQGNVIKETSTMVKISLAQGIKSQAVVGVVVLKHGVADFIQDQINRS